MDFLRSLSKTQKIVIGIAVATLAISLIIWFYGRSKEKMSELPKNPVPDPMPKPLQEPEETRIQEIEEDKPERVLVMFFAPWCGHCKTMMPTWDKFASKWDGYKGIRLLKIDGQADQSMAAKHQVGGFPTVKFCKKGLEDPTDTVMYQGDRSEQDLEQFLKQMA